MKTYGPYLRKDGRKHVVIISDDGTRTTKSWPRILMEQKLGRPLLPEETVDHKDEDKSNDVLDNLQLLSLKENSLKSAVLRRAERIQLVCKCCKTVFERRLALELYDRNVRKKDGPFCSKQCVGKTHH